MDLDIRDYEVDISTGYQYATGSHEKNYFVRGRNIETFILKLDKDYKYVFFRTYESLGRDIQA